MRETAQVGIVGGGPAGARAAELLARHGVDVLILDPRAPWEKPCGGGLTSALFEEMPDFEEVKSLSRAVERARVELTPEVGFEVPLGKPIWIVSREALGRWQLERALTVGASLQVARVVRIDRIARGWRLETDAGRVTVGALIGADGAASTVRATAAPAHPVELVPTRVAYPTEDAPHPDALVLRFYGDLVGYLWDFPRPDHRSVGIEATSGPRRRPALDARIDAYGDSTRWQPSPALARAGAVIGTAQLGHGDFSGIAGSGFALLGDAAGLADPFTGEGIRNALRSAELLAHAWQMGSDWARTYTALARAAFANELAVSRLFRRLLSESGLGVRLVEWAVASDLSYAIAAATLRTMNVHEPSRFFVRCRQALREVRADPGRRGPARSRRVEVEARS